MTPKDGDGEEPHSKHTPLGLDQRRESNKALSPGKIRHPAPIQIYAAWSSLPLVLPKEPQAQAKIDLAFYNGDSLQGRINLDPDGEVLSSVVSEDRFFNTMMTNTVTTRPRTVSRFEEIFVQMRKKSHPALEDMSSVIIPSKCDTFGNCVQHKASVSLSREGFQRKQAIAPLDTTKLSSRGPPEPGKMAPTCSGTVAARVRATQAMIEKHFGPGTLRAFHPSHRALQRNGLLPSRGTCLAAANSTRSNLSTNYLGDPLVENNRSADIPKDENCSLWVLGLPARVTYNALLASIRGIGKVYATVINPPVDEIRTSAAKIVLFNRQDAEKLYNRIEARQFVVMGKLVYRVLWNKIRSGPYPYLNHSRAIRITGPRVLMDFDFFENFFVERFTYDLDGREVVQCQRPGFVCHEWRFGSLRCQAASAKTAIERELKGIYEVEWTDDPCEFP